MVQIFTWDKYHAWETWFRTDKVIKGKKGKENTEDQVDIEVETGENLSQLHAKVQMHLASVSDTVLAVRRFSY